MKEHQQNVIKKVRMRILNRIQIGVRFWIRIQIQIIWIHTESDLLRAVLPGNESVVSAIVMAG